MVIKDMLTQPYQLDQRIVLEKRDAEGKLDFSDPQPPTALDGRCGCCDGLTFRDVYKLFFRSNPDGPPSAGWDELKAWLDERHWVIRPRTW
jgi:hypothetical protein